MIPTGLGRVEIEGDFVVSLANVGGNPFAPGLGDYFDILTSTQNIIGEFDEVTLPSLSWDLNWSLEYLPTAVRLSAVATGDFNDDGIVDAADFSYGAKTAAPSRNTTRCKPPSVK